MSKANNKPKIHEAIFKPLESFDDASRPYYKR